MEAVVADAGIAESRKRGRVDLAAKGVALAKADVVEEDDEDVGGVLLQSRWFDAAPVLGFRQRASGNAGGGRRWKGEDRAVVSSTGDSRRKEAAHEDNLREFGFHGVVEN